MRAKHGSPEAHLASSSWRDETVGQPESPLNASSCRVTGTQASSNTAVSRRAMVARMTEDGEGAKRARVPGGWRQREMNNATCIVSQGCGFSATGASGFA